MLILTACGNTTENEKNKIKSKENAEHQTYDNDVDDEDAEDEILVETDYGKYNIDAEWYTTKEISSGLEGFGFSHNYSNPGSDLIIPNVVTISCSVIPEEVDMSDHEVIKNNIFEHNQRYGSELYFAETVSVEDYDSENHDEVFLFTFTNDQGDVVRREYVMLKGQIQFNVNEDISIYTSSEQEQKEMNEDSDRIAKRALESFRWID